MTPPAPKKIIVQVLIKKTTLKPLPSQKSGKTKKAIMIKTRKTEFQYQQFNNEDIRIKQTKKINLAQNPAKLMHTALSNFTGIASLVYPSDPSKKEHSMINEVTK